ncbi:MAG: hypothetical protein WCJ87_04890, partial [Burkholderiales bacterium]
GLEPKSPEPRMYAPRPGADSERRPGGFGNRSGAPANSRFGKPAFAPRREEGGFAPRRDENFAPRSAGPFDRAPARRPAEGAATPSRAPFKARARTGGFSR